jgi:glycine/D-amino acid oxidase-like deaminating enzyme
MKVSVIGAGYAGLAVCWHLLQYPDIQVTLFDGGAGASSASTGLLHPFPGRTSSRSWMAKEGMEESNFLIGVAEAALGRVVANRGGIRRLPWASWQEKEFLKLTKKDPEALWVESALWIPSGVAVYSKSYMEGLLKASLSKGAILRKENVDSLDSLDADHIVLATGAGTSRFLDLPLIAVKGHALLCRWGGDRLSHSLICNGHITPSEDPDLCMIGSTYEHEFTSSDPDPAYIPQLLAKAQAFYPPAKDFKVVELFSGIRMTQKVGYRPVVERISPSMHVFTGLGSRGLLYHALLGKQIAREIANK